MMKIKKFFILLFLFFLPCCGVDDYSYYDSYHDGCDLFCSNVCNNCYYYGGDILSCESHCHSGCQIRGCDDMNTLSCTELVDELCM